MHKAIWATPLANFCLAATLGLLMRYYLVFPFDMPFRNVVHAHSHVAMLGWVYMALFVLIVRYFVPEEKRKNYNTLFWITEISVLGMLFSFPFQGYGVFSISFSAMHMICSYVFAYKIWKDIKGRRSPAAEMLRISLLFMLLSIMGVWAVGPTVASGGVNSPGFNISLQVFLHFQLNGWFVLAGIALFLKRLKVTYAPSFSLFKVLMVLSIFLTFALPVSWYLPSDVLVGINMGGTLLQILSVLYLIQFLRPVWKKFMSSVGETQRLLAGFLLICFLLKVILQGAAFYAPLAREVLRHQNFVIGFIHLAMLGMITSFLFMMYMKEGVFARTVKILPYGILLFLIGVTASESVVLLQGLRLYLGGRMAPSFHIGVFVSSVVLVLGIWMIFLQMILPTGKTREKADSI